MNVKLIWQLRGQQEEHAVIKDCGLVPVMVRVRADKR